VKYGKEGKGEQDITVEIHQRSEQPKGWVEAVRDIPARMSAGSFVREGNRREGSRKMTSGPF
jgi:hypothetical protein